MQDDPPFAGTSRGLRLAIGIGALLVCAVVAGYVWHALSETTRVRDAAMQSMPRLDALLQSRRERDEAIALYEEQRRGLESGLEGLRLPWSETRLKASVAHAAESAGCPAPARILPIAENQSAAMPGLSLATWELAWDRPESCLPALAAALAEGEPAVHVVNFYADAEKASARVTVPFLPVPPSFPPPAPVPPGSVDSVGRVLDRLRVALSASQNDGLRAREELRAALAETRAVLEAGQSIEPEMREIQLRRQELEKVEQWSRVLGAALKAECPPGGTEILSAVQQAGPVSWTLEAREGAWRLRAEFAPRDLEARLAALTGLTLVEETRSGRFLEAILRPVGPVAAPVAGATAPAAPSTQPETRPDEQD